MFAAGAQTLLVESTWAGALKRSIWSQFEAQRPYISPKSGFPKNTVRTIITALRMNTYVPRSRGPLAIRLISGLITVFGSLAIYGEEVAAYGNEAQAAADAGGVQRSVVAEVTYDPIKTFNDPNEFAAPQFGMPVRFDTMPMLRGVSALPPLRLCAWITGDNGEDKGRSYLQGGTNVQFVFCRDARYPLIVTIPVCMAVGEEEYWFGPHFGYITTGLNVQVPLSFIPSRYGRWSAASRADVCYYGTTVTEFRNSFGPQISKITGALSVDF
jgi:hypothetical protein